MGNSFLSENPEFVWLRAIEASIAVRVSLHKRLCGSRNRALQRIAVRGKEMLFCDKEAEDNCIAFFTDRRNGLSDSLLAEGEETFFDQNPDYSNHQIRIALLDMVDGSDLLERDLGNWCSAMVVFDPRPRPPTILCSVVHDHRERIYSATQTGSFIDEPLYDEQRNITREPIYDQRGNVVEHEIRYAERRPILRIPRIIRDTGEAKEPTNIGVCFYGQKEGHLTTTPLGLDEWLKTVIPRADKRIRIYTLAGNPMMARLANGEMIHAVFEHVGQFPHDAIPGAFIALKAGACMFDIDTGQEISEGTLATYLLHPNDEAKKIRYVIAAEYDLGKSLAEALMKARPGALVYACDECFQERRVSVCDLPEVLCSCGKAMTMIKTVA